MRHLKHISWAQVLVLSLSVAIAGCAKKDEVVVHAAEGAGVSAEELERDPSALLPGRSVAVGYLDAQQLFASEFGTRLLTIWARRAPIPAGADFDPRRDLRSLYIGAYSMQGADFLGVAVGTFNPERLEAAAAASGQTPQGIPIVETRYAERRLFIADTVGFVALTPKLMLVGNPTGLRRALDRIQQRRVKREIPSWFSSQLSASSLPPIVVGADFRASPLPESVRQRFPLVVGLETVGLLGNFMPPGINLAGTFGYHDAPQALAGANNISLLYQNLSSYSLIMSLMGIGQPIRKLEVQPKDKELAVVAEIDGRAVGQLLDQADAWLNANTGRGK
ncbi:MAG: hypothetical protein SFV15_06525 [Polyangiaceae bacterium]|nr:hypothetical protein [Polyangiaceae bacterium]